VADKRVGYPHHIILGIDRMRIAPHEDAAARASVQRMIDLG
jgi:hypothetical protein